MSRWRRIAVVGLALWVAGCGVPVDGEPRAIPSSEVPYGLAERTPAPTAPSAVAPVETPSQLFLVGADEVLVARPREVAGATPDDRLADLLAQLEAGPTATEREEQLSTLLPPEVRLALIGLSRGTATIDLALPEGSPSGGAGRRAVAQLVLTATSLRGVDAVRLTIGGEPVEAPLPTGELTSAPLTAADYAVFLTAPEPPSAVPAPPS
jgi:spore germination protein GerM